MSNDKGNSQPKAKHARYRKIPVKLWDQPSFRALKPTDKAVALYLLTGRQTNRVGLYGVSMALGAENVGMELSEFTSAFRRVCKTLGWIYDRPSRVLFITDWFAMDTPNNQNHLLGCLTDLTEVPDGELKRAFLKNGRHLPAYQRPFLYGYVPDEKGDVSDTYPVRTAPLPDTSPIGTPNQEQEQLQEQLQEPEQEQGPEQEQTNTPPTPSRRSAPNARAKRSRVGLSVSEPEPPYFQEFWDAYPNKQNRHATLKAWRTLDPDGGTVAKILRAVAEQKTWFEWMREGGEYIPFPHRWLKGRRWEDERRVYGLTGNEGEGEPNHIENEPGIGGNGDDSA